MFNLSAVLNVVGVNTSSVRTALGSLNSQLNTSTTKANTFANAIALKGLSLAPYTVASIAIIKLTEAIGSATKDAIRFEVEMANIAQTTRKSTDYVRQHTKYIGELSTSYGLSAPKIAEMTRVLLQAGYSMETAKEAAESLAKTTLLASFDNITDTTDGLIAVQKQFAATMGKSADVLAKVNALSKKYAVESSDLFEVARKAGGAFAATGGKLEDLFAVFTTIRDTTRESSESISVGIRTITARLQRPATATFFDQLGIKIRNAKGEFVGTLAAIQAIQQGLQAGGIKPGSQTYAEVVEKLGGVLQQSRVIPLLEQRAKLQRVIADASSAQSDTDEDLAKSQETLAFKLAETQQNFSKLLREISDTGAFKFITQGVLKLAEAMIELARVSKELLPLLAAFAIANVGASVARRTVGTRISGRAAAAGTAALLGTAVAAHVAGFSTGGRAYGQGLGDTIPAVLTPGEFVLKAPVAQGIGYGRLDRVNKGIERFAKGGVADGPLKNRIKNRASREDEASAEKAAEIIASLNPQGQSHVVPSTQIERELRAAERNSYFLSDKDPDQIKFDTFAADYAKASHQTLDPDAVKAQRASKKNRRKELDTIDPVKDEAKARAEAASAAEANKAALASIQAEKKNAEAQVAIEKAKAQQILIEKEETAKRIQETSKAKAEAQKAKASAPISQNARATMEGSGGIKRKPKVTAASAPIGLLTYTPQADAQKRIGYTPPAQPATSVPEAPKSSFDDSLWFVDSDSDSARMSKWRKMSPDQQEAQTDHNRAIAYAAKQEAKATAPNTGSSSASSASSTSSASGPSFNERLAKIQAEAKAKAEAEAIEQQKIDAANKAEQVQRQKDLEASHKKARDYASTLNDQGLNSDLDLKVSQIRTKVPHTYKRGKGSVDFGAVNPSDFRNIKEEAESLKRALKKEFAKIAPDITGNDATSNVKAKALKDQIEFMDKVYDQITQEEERIATGGASKFNNQAQAKAQAHAKQKAKAKAKTTASNPQPTPDPVKVRPDQRATGQYTGFESPEDIRRRQNRANRAQASVDINSAREAQEAKEAQRQFNQAKKARSRPGGLGHQGTFGNGGLGHPGTYVNQGPPTGGLGHPGFGNSPPKGPPAGPPPSGGGLGHPGSFPPANTPQVRATTTKFDSAIGTGLAVATAIAVGAINEWVTGVTTSIDPKTGEQVQSATGKLVSSILTVVGILGPMAASQVGLSGLSKAVGKLVPILNGARTALTLGGIKAGFGKVLSTLSTLVPAIKARVIKFFVTGAAKQAGQSALAGGGTALAGLGAYEAFAAATRYGGAKFFGRSEGDNQRLGFGGSKGFEETGFANKFLSGESAVMAVKRTYEAYRDMKESEATVERAATQRGVSFEGDNRVVNLNAISSKSNTSVKSSIDKLFQRDDSGAVTGLTDAGKAFAENGGENTLNEMTKAFANSGKEATEFQLALGQLKTEEGLAVSSLIETYQLENAAKIQAIAANERATQAALGFEQAITRASSIAELGDLVSNISGNFKVNAASKVVSSGSASGIARIGGQLGANQGAINVVTENYGRRDAVKLAKANLGRTGDYEAFSKELRSIIDASGLSETPSERLETMFAPQLLEVIDAMSGVGTAAFELEKSFNEAAANADSAFNSYVDSLDKTIDAQLSYNSSVISFGNSYRNNLKDLEGFSATGTTIANIRSRRGTIGNLGDSSGLRRNAALSSAQLSGVGGQLVNAEAAGLGNTEAAGNLQKTFALLQASVKGQIGLIKQDSEVRQQMIESLKEELSLEQNRAKSFTDINRALSGEEGRDSQRAAKKAAKEAERIQSLFDTQGAGAAQSALGKYANRGGNTQQIKALLSLNAQSGIEAASQSRGSQYFRGSLRGDSFSSGSTGFTQNGRQVGAELQFQQNQQLANDAVLAQLQYDNLLLLAHSSDVLMRSADIMGMHFDNFGIKLNNIVESLNNASIKMTMEPSNIVVSFNNAQGLELISREMKRMAIEVVNQRFLEQAQGIR